MLFDEFKNNVIVELCKCRSLSKEEIIKDVEKESDWLEEFYRKGKNTGDFEHAKNLAVDNFSLWV